MNNTTPLRELPAMTPKYMAEVVQAAIETLCANGFQSRTHRLCEVRDQLLSARDEAEEQPHCHRHTGFDYDCIECGDVLETWRKEGKGKFATQPASGEAVTIEATDLGAVMDYEIATPPAASGDVEARALAGGLESIVGKTGNVNDNWILQTSATLIRRLAAVTPAGMVRCSHNWLDYGEHAGNNLAYCPRCKMISAVGKEGVPYGLPTPPATAGEG